MTIDWNWFFAAFAQCAAGLIAIIGAFIISKLLGEVEKEEMHSSNIGQLIIEYNDLIKRISGRYFDWYDKQSIEYSSSLDDAIKNGDFNGLNDDEKLQKLYKIELRLFGTSNCLEVLNEKIKKLTCTTHSSFLAKIIPTGLWEKLNTEREIIGLLKIESETLVEKFKKAKSDMSITQNNLKPIKTTIYILGIGLLLTVIYPLSLMPIKLNQNPTFSFSFGTLCNDLFSIKGLLLFLLTLVIEGIFGYFLWIINAVERKYSFESLRLQEKYFSISDYCQYFIDK